ncbi:MAG: cyanophycinase [Saprospiraceae bacterium]|nr:cyanophycinase [Saprospiraceae bacterium]
MCRTTISTILLLVWWCATSFAQPVTSGPEAGTLIIIGGAARDTVFVNTFMRMAGGPDAPIVVIPTAQEQPGGANGDLERVGDYFREHGFNQVTVRHTRDRAVADQDTFVAPIHAARGIWLTGGRQWRLVDAYAGTRTLEAMWDVLKRGGVIAGSSAGATIQGSYLARGDTRTNTIMMGDHEEGFGFITNVAIDQHTLARNRQFDIFEILEVHPHLLGMSIDENTGIVVQGNTGVVIGNSYLLMYDGTEWNDATREYEPVPIERRPFHTLRRGDVYDFAKRKVVKKR